MEIDGETVTMALYWQVSGQGQDLVLVHGWGMNGAVWQQTAEALSDHFECMWWTYPVMVIVPSNMPQA